MYKAIFKNVDYPKDADYEDYFMHKADAINYVIARASEYKVTVFDWVYRPYGQHFNAESTKPDYFYGWYHGSVEERTLK